MSYLLLLVFFLFLVRKRSPHFTEFLANSAESNLGVVLFDFLTVFLAAINCGRCELRRHSSCGSRCSKADAGNG